MYYGIVLLSIRPLPFFFSKKLTDTSNPAKIAKSVVLTLLKMQEKNELIARDLLKTVEKYLPQREYLAVVGPRQAGKTTLLEMLQKTHPEASYLTFEDRKVLALFEEDIDSFISLYCQKEKLLLVDEFQYAKNGGKNLKYIFDTVKGLKVVITGSSSLELKANVGKHMVGRIFFFNLWPLSFAEFLSFRDRKLFELYRKKRFDFEKPPTVTAKPQNDSLSLHFLPLFEEHLTFGGYPRLATARNAEEKRTVLDNIVSTYLLRDVKGFLQIEHETSYLKLISALALQIGNLYNLKELSNTTKLDYRQLVSYLDALRQTFIIEDLSPFYTNPRTELTKTPKVYFLDLGLRNATIDNFVSPEKRADCGALAENFVFNSLSSANFKINFWRTKSKAEIDFVIRHGEKIIPCEVKYQTGFASIPKSFYGFLEKYNFPFGLVITRDMIGAKRINGKTLFFYPIYLL